MNLNEYSEALEENVYSYLYLCVYIYIFYFESPVVKYNKKKNLYKILFLHSTIIKQLHMEV